MQLSKLFQITVNFIRSILKRVAVRAVPQKIGSYILVKDLSPKKTFPYRVALYRQANRFAVAKIWQGAHKDRYYYTLKQEITNYQVLSALSRRLRTQTPTVYKKIRLPQFLGSTPQRGLLVLFLEYIPRAQSITAWPVSKQHTAYMRCVNYLRFLGSHCTVHEKQLIRVKGVRYFLLLYPALLVAALIRNPARIKIVLQGIPIVLRSLPPLLRFRSYTLVHGDLHSENIRRAKQGLVLMDLEQMMFTYPVLEIIATLSTPKMTAAFRQDLTKRIAAPLRQDTQFYKLFRALLVICSTYNLTWTREPKNIEIYTTLLKKPAFFASRYV